MPLPSRINPSLAALALLSCDEYGRTNGDPAAPK
jgi:hypothetical protein